MAQRQGGMQLESLSPQQLQVRARSRARDLADRLKRRPGGGSLFARFSIGAPGGARGGDTPRLEPSRRARGHVTPATAPPASRFRI